ncbi:hypothetical protein FRACYDRAFT_232299 [Fragilariopsis cylindrus CCMP1102]|uniref:Uncharacterized protein n=1 Tax=Fragilariopsis cylindrus CCMP1102 TaxID=635003 RepID=A0A1E7FVH3_9STRA|nr:hypothetical protein FRACYDRAFT_232299 [Fragilariopsis cylindrus CCMP1102]|eukprot:OEU22146.1 hypothetical protein FRACYDRAFT_232299 [Fragilariopsis cylindrus CCMP1102]
MIENASRLTRFLLSKKIPSIIGQQASRRAAAPITIRYISSSSSSSSVENGGTSTSTSSSDDDDGTTFVVFPWRTKSSLLPRLVPGTPEHTKDGLLLTSKSQSLHGSSSLNAIVTSYMFLNVPWYELFWISDVKDELSSSVSWAFTHGVANLLSNLSSSSSSGISVSADSIISHRTDDSTTCGIDFHKTLEFNNNNNNDSDSGSGSDEGNTSINATSIDNNSKNNTIQLQHMFEEKVVAHYKSAINNFATKEGSKDDISAGSSSSSSSSSSISNHSKKNQRLEVRLSMVPFKTDFITLYAIPYLSRRNAKSDTVLLDFYREMLEMPSTKRASYLSQLRQEHLENKGYMESTIIAQCVVWCDEFFYVKDLTTGQILQGEEQEQEHNDSEGKQNDHSTSITADSKKIPHLVRMERTVITKKDSITGSFHNVQEDWVITDIDDILGGNLII